MSNPVDLDQKEAALPDDVMLRRLLLGNVSDAERARLEEVYFTSVAAFERLMAVEEELADEYVSGTLSAEDRQAFERVFAVTPAGRRRLQSAQVFHQALAEFAQQSPEAHRSSTRLRLHWRVLTVIFILTIAAVAVVSMLEVRRLKQEAVVLQSERAILLERADTLRQDVEALQNRTVHIADSRTDFSCTQGRDNWYYGYYDGPFENSDFQLMTQCNADRFYGPGSSWWVDPARFWTSIGAAVTFPNGPKSCGRQPVEHWAVRRWVSEVSGTITATGTLRDLLGEFDGFIAHVLIDGKSTWNFTVPPGSSTTPPIPYRATFAVERGTPVDFAIQPRWSDCNDHAEFLISLSSQAPLRPGPAPR